MRTTLCRIAVSCCLSVALAGFWSVVVRTCIRLLC